MKVKENVTIYQCEFCKRKMFVKSAMQKHETFCYSNPANFRACSGCIHLEEVEVEYSYSVPSLGENLGVVFDGDTVTKKTTGFHCKKLNKHLYPFKAEKMGLINKYPESFEDKEPMPKVCEDFDDGLAFLTSHTNF